MKKITLSFFIAGISFILFYFLFLIANTFIAKHSTDCRSHVIDSYEVHSKINIPKVEVVNCYYDESVKVRTTLYQLKAPINTEKFTVADANFRLIGHDGLVEKEQPKGELLIATGISSGKKWTYLFNPEKQLLWAELSFF